MLRPHLAADGALVRVRLPGGRTTGSVLRAIGRLAQTYGSGEVQLTSRGGLQIRGLPAPMGDRSVPAGFVDAVRALGLLPSPAHERVRNVVASPLTGVSGGQAEVAGLVADLDRRLLAEPRLADLPGRFLFAVDDGRGDVAGLDFDVGYRARSPAAGLILVGDAQLGRPVAAVDAAAAMVALALDFLPDRGDAWRVADRPGWAAAQRDGMVPAPPPGRTGVRLGAVGGAASVHVPLGRLTAPQITAVADAAGEREVVVTPWRGLVLPGAAGALADLTAAGLVGEDTSPWPLVSACVGAPHCASAGAHTRAAAQDLVAAGAVEGRIHLSGCSRRCGAPHGPHADWVAAGVGTPALAVR